jgi:hypothetical protein
MIKIILCLARLAGEKFEVAIDGREWEGDEDFEEEAYLSEEGVSHSGSLHTGDEGEYYSDQGRYEEHHHVQPGRAGQVRGRQDGLVRAL